MEEVCQEDWRRWFAKKISAQFAKKKMEEVDRLRADPLRRRWFVSELFPLGHQAVTHPQPGTHPPATGKGGRNMVHEHRKGKWVFDPHRF